MMPRMLHRLLRWLFPQRPTSIPATSEDDNPFGVDPSTPHTLPLEDWLDLHPFSPRDIPSVVEEYLWAAQQAGFREVRLVHGRGKGVQRRVVQSLLARHPAVESFSDAPAHRGGWGATVAWLRPRASSA